MVGKKKKKEKNLGLSLSRIGSSLIPNAVFTAVPRTAQQLSETWPRKTNSSSRLATALGSVGNLAQAVVVGTTPSSREEFESNASTSNARIEDIEDYESEEHYAEVDENILKNHSSSRKEGDADEENRIDSSVKNKEVIYATVNKRRKPKVVEDDLIESSCGSEDDITDVSGMCSGDEDSLSSVDINQPTLSSKPEPKKQDSRRRKSSKVKSKKNSQHTPSETVEEHVIKSDINSNYITTSDFPDGFLPDDYQAEQLMNKDKDMSDNEHELHRNYHQPSEFEREEFNGTNLDQYSSGGSPPLIRTREEPLSASAPDLVGYPEVPPIGERETPIGKGLSSESIGSFKEQYHMEKLPTKQESLYKHQLQQLQEDKQRKLYDDNQATLQQQMSTSTAQNDEKVMHRKQEPVIMKRKLSEIDHLQHLDSSENTVTRICSSQGENENIKRTIIPSEQLTENTARIHISQRENENFQKTISSEQPTENTARIHISQRENENFQKTIPSEQLSEKLENSKKDRKLNEERHAVTEVKTKEMKRKEKKKNRNKRQLSKVVEEIKSKPSVYTNHEDYLTDGSEEKIRQLTKNATKSSKYTRKETFDSEGQSNMEMNAPPQDFRTETLQQMSTTLAKETCRKLRRQVKVLDQEKSALESLSQSLNDENKTLKKLSQSLTNKTEAGSGTSLSVLQLRNEELKDENNFLNDSLHRLNVELGRYQAKFRPLPPQEMDTMFQSGERQPPWLMNKKYLAPLLLAYDDRVKEKQDTIKAYEEELQSFKERVGEIVQENLELRESISKSQILSHDMEECVQLEEQARLVLEENAVLMERQEMQNSKIEEVKAIYKEEVSRLTKLYTTSESEKGVLESKLEVMNTTLNGVKEEFGKSSTEWKKRIPVEEHLDTVNECRRKLEALKKMTEEETESLNFQLETVQKEKNSLTAQLSDYKLVNVQLEREVHKFTEIQRKNERKTLLLKEKLNHIQERETTAQDTLSEVLKVAEKTSSERDMLNEMLASKQSEQKKVESRVKHEEDKLKDCKNKAYNKIAAIKGRVKEQERVTDKLKDRYENEINSLKTFIRRQQMQLEDMVNDKRDLENELNEIYKKVGDDSIAANIVT